MKTRKEKIKLSSKAIKKYDLMVEEVQKKLVKTITYTNTQSLIKYLQNKN